MNLFTIGMLGLSLIVAAPNKLEGPDIDWLGRFTTAYEAQDVAAMKELAEGKELEWITEEIERCKRQNVKETLSVEVVGRVGTGEKMRGLITDITCRTGTRPPKPAFRMIFEFRIENGKAILVNSSRPDVEKNNEAFRKAWRLGASLQFGVAKKDLEIIAGLFGLSVKDTGSQTEPLAEAAAAFEQIKMIISNNEHLHFESVSRHNGNSWSVNFLVCKEPDIPAERKPFTLVASFQKESGKVVFRGVAKKKKGVRQDNKESRKVGENE